ncbi:hypothetical protein D3C71_1643400 [compost metagenome]
MNAGLGIQKVQRKELFFRQVHPQGVAAEFARHVVGAQHLVEAFAQGHLAQMHVRQLPAFQNVGVHDQVKVSCVGKCAQDLADAGLGHRHVDQLAFKRIKHRRHGGDDRRRSRFGHLGQQHLLVDQKPLRLLRGVLTHLVCSRRIGRREAGRTARRLTRTTSQHQNGTYQRKRLEKRRIVHIAVLGATSVIL